MPDSEREARKLAGYLRVMGHPDRVRIIGELAADEKDVKTLLAQLKLPGPRVSQHLSLLRAHRIVESRRRGRQHIYRLCQPQLAAWMMQFPIVFDDSACLPR